MMAPQKKKPLPGQHHKVEPLTRKMEAAAPPRPQLEVLQERMNQTATAVQVDKLHGEAMGRIEILQERTKSMATTADMNKLHGEAMERIGKVETCIGEIKGDLKFIKWIGGTLGIAIVAGLITMIAGLAKIIFFPVV